MISHPQKNHRPQSARGAKALVIGQLQAKTSAPMRVFEWPLIKSLESFARAARHVVNQAIDASRGRYDL